MKFAFITLDFKRFPLGFCFQCAQYYGFDGVEIWCGRPHAYPEDMTPQRIREIISWKKKYGKEVPMMVPVALNVNQGLASLNEAERAASVAWIKRHIDMAKEIECPRVLVAPDHPGYNTDGALVWKAFVESIQELADYAKGTGVRITAEPLTTMESPVLCHTDDCLRLLRDVPQDELHFMMDVVPPTMEFEPFSDYFTKLGSRMDYIHICNTDGMTDAHVRLENGIIPIEDMLAVFKHWNYDSYISLELYSENYRDPELFLANSSRVIREACGRLGIQTRVDNRGIK